MSWYEDYLDAVELQGFKGSYQDWLDYYKDDYEDYTDDEEFDDDQRY